MVEIINNFDFGISEIFNANNTKWFIDFSKKFYEEQLENSELLANEYDRYNHKISVSDFFGENNVFGELSENHAFMHNDLGLGFELTEPHITKTIASKIGYSQDFGKSFVYALQNEMPKRIISAEAEEPTKNGKRIDLAIKWIDKEDKKRLSIIEAKFGHKLTTGQLKAYRDWGSKQASFENPDFIYLTKTGELPPKKLQTKERWKCVSWLSVLRRWETILSKYENKENPNDEDIQSSDHSFRNAIWRKSL